MSININRPETPTMELGVLVCGMPSSGNRIVRHGIRRMPEVGHAQILHWGEGFEGEVKAVRAAGLKAVAVIPLRDRGPQWESYQGNGCKHASPEKAHADHFWMTLYELARLHIPVYPIIYRAMVEDQEGEGLLLAHWLGATWNGWGVDIYDADAKYGGGENPETPGARVTGDGTKVGQIEARLTLRGRALQGTPIR